MFRQYQLRSTSSSSRSASSRPRTSVSPANSRGGTPAITTSAPRAPASEALVEESISLGVRRCQANDEENGAQLAPDHIKCLKTYAKKLCSDRSVDEKPIMDFIDTGDVACMLVDIKVTFATYEAGKKESQLQELQELLVSKDFGTSLSKRLLACILSPNITAYVTDTQHHIMNFIAGNLDIFKILAAVVKDSELLETLRKVVIRLLSDIRSRLKGNLTTSIVKKMCIINVAKAAANAGGGMEVDAAHWTRLSFLRLCLRLFLIGTSDHKMALLDICFIPRLIPFLKSDMHAKIEQELGIDVKAMAKELHKCPEPDPATNDAVDPATNSGNGPATNSGDGSAPSTNGPADPANFDWNTGYDEENTSNADTEVDENGDAQDNDDDDLDASDSGFGLNRKPARFNSTKFWNYVDYMLNLLRQTAHKTAATKELYDREFQKYMVQIFQDDLAECPGPRRGSKLMSVVNPPWQSTIQQELIW